MPREVLAAVAHAGFEQAVHQALGERGDDARVAMEGAVADHAAAAVVEVEHRREAEVDAAGAQLAREHMAGGGGGLEGAHRAGARSAAAVVHPHLAEHAHRRQLGEAVAAEALHPAAFVIDAHQHVGPQRLDLGDQLGQLPPVAPVAGEQDHPAGERMLQAAAVIGLEGEAGDVEHHRRMDRFLHRSLRVSTTTKLAA